MNKKIIHSVFEAQVIITPNNTAIEFENTSISYTKLNQKANKLANYLRSEFARPNESIIGSFFNSGIQHVISLISIFKSGGIYLPLAADMPQSRWSNVFTKIHPALIICSDDNLFELISILETNQLKRYCIITINNDFDFSVIEFDNGAIKKNVPELLNEDNPTLINEPDDSNYIYHTSGSTGESKAIIGCHKSLSHFIFWEKNEFSIDASFRVSQLTAVTFDASLRDIFLPLCSGGTLCIPEPEIRNNSELLLKWIYTSRINLIHCVPSLLRGITKNSNGAAFPYLKFILISGEMLYSKDIHAWRDFFGNHLEFVNLYGATETTLIKTFYRINNSTKLGQKTIPVGFPISNTTVIIANRGELCKPGEIGEIYIKTPFTSKGYLDNQALTETVFVQNPINAKEKDVVYKTGDLGRYGDDWCIELVGRMDSQVKVNGIRVELSEIENALLNVEGIDKAVVTHSTNSGNETVLSCYYSSSTTKIKEEIKKELLAFLPNSLLPSFYVQMNEFPLTINGKVDKRALPRPEELIYDSLEYKAPVRDIEKELCIIWTEILGIKRIGVNISFFELGGNSLLAINMVGQIYRKWNIDIKLKDFFSSPTVEKLADMLLGSEQGNYSEIPIAAIQEYYVVSSAQKRLWLLNQLEDSDAAYILSAAFEVRGNLRLDIFEKSLYYLVERHESLRTVFMDIEGDVMQLIKPLEESGFKIEHSVIADAKDDPAVLNKYIDEEVEKKIDLGDGPLFRTKVFHVDDNRHVLVFLMHHIISDGVSIGILLKELSELYNSKLRGETIPAIPELKIQYKDYSLWQKNLKGKETLQKQKDFWNKQFEGELPFLALKTDYNRPKLKTYNGAGIQGMLDKDLTSELSAIASKNNSSLFMVLYAGVNALLFRYTQQTDIILGTPAAGRTHDGLNNVIGCFVNTLALRARFNAEDTFNDLLEKCRTVTLEAFDNQLYPFDELVDDLTGKKDRSRSVLFDVMVTLQNTSLKKEHSPDLENVDICSYPIPLGNTKFDITFNFYEDGQGISYLIEYNTDIYCEKRITNICSHLKNLFQVVVNKPSEKLMVLDYISSEEKKEILEDYNDTDHEINFQSVVKLIEKRAGLHPDRTAIVFNKQDLSFGDLNNKANRISHNLIEKYKIRKGEVAIILMERTEMMFISMLAVMKCGAIYLPVSPDYPSERINWIIRDSNAKIVISDAGSEGDYTIPVFNLNVQQREKNKVGNPEVNLKPEDIAYIIYTSGSTGNPKGVIINYEGLFNRILWQWTELNFTDQDIIVQKTANTFDVSVWELFMPPSFGAKMIVCPLDTVQDHHKLMDLIKEEKVTTVHFVPTVYNSFLEVIDEVSVNKLSTLKRVITSGEALLPVTVNSHYKKLPKASLINLYGPTEASIDVSYYRVQPGDNIVYIGKPVWNTKLYILDNLLQPVPPGISGELYIGGVQLGKGYMNNPVLTAERFINNPFDNAKRLYRTGDICCWSYNGNIEYMGRSDDQVKVSGYRIELGEIEAHLLTFKGITRVCAMVWQQDQRKTLVAYYESPEAFESISLRKYLKSTLPDYMIPSVFVWVERFPLTSSSKIDKRALSVYKTEEKPAYTKPVSKTEEVLIEIWEDVLGTKPVSIDDDFFDLGGHSLKAMQIVALVFNKMGIKLHVKAIFDHATVRRVAQVIEESEKIYTERIDKAPENFAYPLSHPQKRLWIIDQMESGNTSAYNVSGAFVLSGNLDIEAFKQALNYLMSRHEILRTCFKLHEGEPLQFITDRNLGNIELVDLVNDADAFFKVEKYIIREAQKLFNLEKDLLMRVKLIRLNENQHVFTLSMHHIISDGWSMQIFIKELFLAYKTYKQLEEVNLPVQRIQYKDYAIWQVKNSLHSEMYWLKKLDKKVEYVNFNYDYPRKAFNEFKGSIETIIVSKEQTGLLNTLAKKNRTSLSTLIFTLYSVLLNKLTGDEVINIGMTVANRNDKDIQDLLGLFVNTIVIQTDYSKDLSFEELLEVQTKNILESLEYQSYPFDSLVDKLKPERKNNHQPLINVAYTFHNQKDLNISRELITATDEKVIIDGLEIDYFGTEETSKKINNNSKYDMLMLVTAEEHINVAIEYNTDLFSENTIKKYLAFFKGIIEQVVV
jgi:amino acid adenylation domain-containing protein